MPVGAIPVTPVTIALSWITEPNGMALGDATTAWLARCISVTTVGVAMFTVNGSQGDSSPK